MAMKFRSVGTLAALSIQVLASVVALSACSSIGDPEPQGIGKPVDGDGTSSSTSDQPATTDDGTPDDGSPANTGDDGDDSPDSPTSTGSNTTPGNSSNPTGTGDPTEPPTGTPTMPSPPDEPGVASEAFYGPRIRRMTNQEFEASLHALLGSMTATQAGFVPDARQSGFVRNEGQIVDPLFARQLQQAADTAAAEYVSTKLNSAVACAASGDAACATTFFTEFLPRAFRRAVSAEEVDALVSGVYATGAEGGGFSAGMQLAISAALQSAAFLYHSELGDSTNGSATTLTNDETASQLAYLFTGAPPDAELLATVTDGSIAASDVRATQARRLLGLPAAQEQVVQLVEQWLGLDALAAIGKDNALFDKYETTWRASMLRETADFVKEVAFNQGGSIKTLLGADYTVADDVMRQFYGNLGSPDADGHVSLAGTGRLGILNQATFLARYATEIESAPIRRGVAVARRVMCITIADPAALNLAVVPPPPDPSKSVRERFEQHSTDDQCKGCHSGIDAVGFTFEGFDAVGAKKDSADTATTLPDGWMLDFPEASLTDSAQLAEQLSNSSDVKRCFTRNLTRFAGAATNQAVENYFLNTWQGLEATSQDSILELLVAYAASDIFVTRGDSQ